MKNSLIILIALISIMITPAEAKESKQKDKQITTIVQKHKVKKVKTTKKSNSLVGMASWYGYESGPKTANGEKFNPNHLTAAHKHIPFGTKVKVTNLKNNKSVIVVINDRGPFNNRIIDLTKSAAKAIGITGVGKVSLSVVS